MAAKPPASEPAPRRRWRWLRHEAIDLGDVIVQILAVVVGILLALFINNWVTQQQQRASVDETMRAVRTELAANRAALRQSAAALTAMATRMRDSPKNRSEPPRWCFQWAGWTGTNSPNLLDAAYQTAIATQALSYMSFAQAQRVAAVYGHQHVKQKDFDLAQSRILIGGPQTLDVCLAGITSVVGDERVLDSQYAPLIGPDPRPWPSPSPDRFASNSSK